jgi:predicted ATP-grasp superfamily ATP-dependent carboligase
MGSAEGHEGAVVFDWLASSKGQATIATVEGATVVVASAVDGPAAGAALAGIEALINAVLKQVVSTEQLSVAAAKQSGTGTQKAAVVVADVAPQVSSILQTLGVKSPEVAQVQSISTVVASSVAAIMNAFPAHV